MGQLPPSNLQPTLVGETVLIRPIAAADWPEMFWPPQTP